MDRQKFRGAGRSRQQGLTTVEYAIAGAIITAAIVLSFDRLGGAVATQVSRVATAVASNGQAAAPTTPGNGN